ncbi:MAG TPA: 4-(cytidine 5'-diphospho)-2-C-methyl-D-erythritol kinase [Pirellulales bacterium]|jgi:4-diphosphocytidyl-2-C-methyl-D-erythritol kinase|nr:4-(cytidine 5'-diphospho)-2-C-methyl-D-erythritol kinase [Pirellulales bacterium]
MNVHRIAPGVAIRAPAKLNLFFEIQAKRGDGYHEVETLMVPISLFDTLRAVRRSDGAISVNCRWASARVAKICGPLPSEADNLATRAVVLLRERAGADFGIEIELTKRIPSAAGLGGGSSDAAAALLAANALWELNWSRAQLAELAAELGSDVPFFLGSGAAICRGRGERVESLGAVGAFHFVVVRPPDGLATSAVYARVRVAEQKRSANDLMRALAGGRRRAACEGVFNRLEESARSLSQWVERLSQVFSRQGCLAAQMSGSGSAYFGICRSARHARRVAHRLQAQAVGLVYAVSSSN